MYYGLLLQIHTLVRWLVLAGVVLPLIQSYSGLLWPRPFSKYDHKAVALGTMAGHTQLLVGMALYMSSPFVALFWSDPGEGVTNRQLLFFSMIHMLGMATSVVLMSVGSSLAKRATGDRQKFRLIATYWTIAAVVILLLIPWPISPLAQRPLWRPF
jgi:hypothetical protein